MKIWQRIFIVTMFIVTVFTLAMGLLLIGNQYKYQIDAEINNSKKFHENVMASVNVEVQRQTYDVTATYIATVVSQIYGKKFRIKGTYNGRIFTRIIVNVKNVNDGSIIKTETIDKVISQ